MGAGAGAAWVLKRAQRTQQLLMELPRESTDLQATLDTLMQVPGGFSRLTALSVRAWPDSEDVPSLIMAVSWLVGQAKGLVFLSIGAVGLPHLPSLAHIRHLQLDVCGENFSRLAPALSTLVTLQTLCLDGTRLDESDGPPADLDLQALTQLESVMLDGIYPASLLLPEGAALHAVAYSLDDASDSFWPTVVGALRSFTLATSERILTEEDIPMWMLEPIKLDTFMVISKCFGKGCTDDERFRQIELRGAFLRAESFCISCTDGIYVTVPGEHEWALVNMLSDQKLYVQLLDVAKFATCPEFVFRYKDLEGADLISLTSVLAKRGSEFCLDEYGEPEVMFATRGWPGVLHCDALDCTTCRCEACRDCCRLDNYQGKRIPSEEYHMYNR